MTHRSPGSTSIIEPPSDDPLFRTQFNPPLLHLPGLNLPVPKILNPNGIPFFRTFETYVEYSHH